MSVDAKTRKIQGRRLKSIRVAAGFGSMRSAALECNWPESTYKAHEKGERTIGYDDAVRYVARFTREGAKGYTAKWLMFGEDQSIDEMIRDEAPDVIERIFEVVRAELEKTK